MFLTSCRALRSLTTNSIIVSAVIIGASFVISSRVDAQEIGIVADNATKSVTVFDGSADVILGSVVIPSVGSAVGDCAVNADRTFGYVTDFGGRVWVIDLTTTPPTIASGTNPIMISNNGEDLVISPDGKFLLVCDGSAVQPVSVIDIALRTEISTLSVGSDCNSIDICPDGSVLVTSFNTDVVLRLTLSATGVLTNTGETLSASNPGNVYCAPDGNSGIVLNRGTNDIISFTIPGLTPVSSRSLSGSSFGISGVFNNAGTLFYVLRQDGAVDVYGFNSGSGSLSVSPSLSFLASSGVIQFFGMDQIALHPNQTKLYVSTSGALNVFDAGTGTLLSAMTGPSISQPTGISFAATSLGLVCVAPADTAILLCASSQVQLPFFVSDTCGGATCQIVSGPGTLIGNMWTYTPLADEIATVILSCSDTCGNTCLDTFTVAFDINDAPVCSLPSDTVLGVCSGGGVSLPIGGSDQNGNFLGCQLISGPGALQGDSLWTYSPTTSGTVTMTVECFDLCGASCQGSFTVQIFFTDIEPPVITCPPDMLVQSPDDVPPPDTASCNLSTLYGSAPNQGLFKIDPLTGAAVYIGSMGNSSIPALAIDPTTGIMYVGTGGGSPRLYTVDTATAQTTLVGSVNIGFGAVGGLEFDANGLLYAAVNIVNDGGSGSDHLATIDKATGLATIIGSFGTCATCLEGMEGLAFDAGGQLWGSLSERGLSGTPGLYKIDINTGLATFITTFQDSLGLPPSGGVVSLKFGCSNTLYGGTATALSSNDGGQLISIDPNTGQFTTIASVTSGRSLGGLAGFRGGGSIQVTDNCDPDPTVVLLSESSDGQSCPETITRTYRATDASGNSALCTQTILVHDTIAPVCIVSSDRDFFQCLPVEVCLPIQISDNTDSTVTTQIIAGPGVLNDTGWCYTPAGDEIVSVTIRCTDDCGNATEVTFTVTFDINEPPICGIPSDTSVITCPAAIIIRPLTTVDPDNNLVSCTVISGPGSIVNGAWQYSPLVDEVATVTILCVDECGESCQGSFTISIDVDDPIPPVISCPPTLLVQCVADIPPPGGAQSSEWVLETSPPAGIEGAAGGVIGDKLYISHGYTGSDDRRLFIYDIPSNTWSTGPSASFSRSELAGGVAGGKLYAIGGRTPGAQHIVECYNPLTNSWTRVADLPTPRGGLGAASLGGKIYAIGGRSGGTFGTGTLYSANEVYNPVTNTWTSLAPMPTALSDVYATVAYDDKVYVFGGAMNFNIVTGLLQIYDPSSNTWTMGASMPTNRAAAMCGVLGGRIVVFGGYDPGFGNLGVTEIYDPSSDSWTTGPNLATTASEIAQGPTFTSQEIFAVGSGIFGARLPILQTLGSGGPVASDNCDPNPEVIHVSDVSDGQTCPETISRTYRATDDAGNSAECVQTIIVNDTISPICLAPNDTTIFLCQTLEVLLPVGATDNCDTQVDIEISAGPGILVNGFWSYTPASEEVVSVTILGTDDCGNTCTEQFTVTFDFNQPPICVVPADTSIFYCEPTQICLPVSATDVDNNLLECKIVGGPGSLDNGVWCYDPMVDQTTFVTINCIDSCGASCETTFKVQIDINEPPQLTCPVDTTMHFNEILVLNPTATDPELATQSGEKLIFSLGPNSPGFATISSTTGQITIVPSNVDVCVHTIEVIVTDFCGIADSCSFTVCVQNTPPVATCDTIPNSICWGAQVSGTINSTDDDSGPFPANYSLASFDGPGSVNIDPVTGSWSWDTQEDAAYIGNFQLCIKVTDGANVCDSCSPSNADTCCVEIVVVQTYRVAIESKDPVIQGGAVNLSVNLEGGYPSYPMGGYDFLIEYDASVLAITGASEGEFLSANNWEFFTFRFGQNGNCGSGCPTGLFRMIALAEQNDGIITSTGYTNTEAGSDQLAIMHFQVSSDRTLQCNFVGVNWRWFDCGDNTISSVSGDTLFASRFVYNRDGVFGDGGISSIDGTDQVFPTYTGAPDTCNTSGGPGKPTPLRKIDFKNGGMKLACNAEIDDRGDINLNGLANEIADAVLFTNYFISGVSIFTIPDAITGAPGTGQIQATDVNADGIVLTVADLVYLVRVIVGDALPINKLVHNFKSARITTRGNIISTDIELGAALFVFQGEASVELLQSDLTLKVGQREGNTYALVIPRMTESAISSSSIAPGAIISTDGKLLTVSGADYFGSVLNIVTDVLPTTFSVRQNYPNPFNPSTKIGFDLPESAEYVVTIYNAAGQTVDEIVGNASAGLVEVEWNASAMASGIYFYKVTAGTISVTKKMALIK